jgi:hypothetical protein
VDKALDTLQMFALSHTFHLGITRSYFQHLKAEYPKLIGPERQEVKMASKGCPWKKFPLVMTHYQWRPKFGKQSYKAWWNQFWRYADRDQALGKDAIYQAADSSWWE